MSETGEILRSIEAMRREFREDLKEIKDEVKRTNGKVTSHEKRLTVIETREEDDRAGKKRLRDWYPQVAGGVVLLAVNLLLSTIFITH